jgi:hypothetical protein
MVGTLVGGCVLVGVYVIAGGAVFVDTVWIGNKVFTGTEVRVAVKVGEEISDVGLGVRDGVLVSAANPVGRADPRIGMDTIKVRALDETISVGSNGKTETIGS